MDNALAIVGFYFTIIGFISGLFFTRLDSWYGDVREFSGSVSIMEEIKEFKQARNKLAGLKSAKPSGSYISIGVLTTILLLMTFFIPLEQSTVNATVFLRFPIILTVLAYWLGGGWIFYQANKLIKQAEQRINKVFQSSNQIR